MISAVATIALASQPASNLPFVSHLFSNDMILQRGKADAIWGWTTPGAKVQVSIAGHRDTVKADKDGKWLARGPKMRAGGSYTLRIKGPQTAEFKNVTYGDVWICGGQSNMEFGVGNLIEGKQVIAEANHSDIRLFYVADKTSVTPLKTVNARWQVCTPQTITSSGDWGGLSAVGYFFGTRLNKDLHVPIGLIHDNWGGTVAEAWTTEPMLAKRLPEFVPAIEILKASARSEKPFAQQMADWYKTNDQGLASTPPWSAVDLDDSGWETMSVPGFVQNARLADLVNQQSLFWLRRTFTVAPGQSLTGAHAHFVADDDDSTWINGTLIGATDGWNSQRSYVIPDGLLHEGVNTIAVRVTDSQAPGGIYDSGGYGTYIELADKSQISLEGAWKVKLSTVITQKNGLPVSTIGNPNQPSVLYNGMISPLVPFGIKGAIWYQGEANVGRANQYEKLLPAMIQSWRDSFGQGDFPFLIVQLAGFGKPPVQPGNDAWAELRDAQLYTARGVRNVGIATAIDVGESGDIHPKNKLAVGTRLALVYEGQFLGHDVVFAGPEFSYVVSEGNAIRVHFRKTQDLKTADGKPIRGFAVAGSDHRWYWADAKIDGQTVLVSSPDVPNPMAVRYAWSDFADLNLQNADGLPAFPFRSDDWPSGS